MVANPTPIALPHRGGPKNNPAAVHTGNLLRNYRLRRGWTITQAATTAHVDGSYLSRLETGERAHYPSREIIYTLIKGYELSPTERSELLASAEIMPWTWSHLLNQVACAINDPAVPPAFLELLGAGIALLHDRGIIHD